MDPDLAPVEDRSNVPADLRNELTIVPASPAPSTFSFTAGPPPATPGEFSLGRMPSTYPTAAAASAATTATARYGALEGSFVSGAPVAQTPFTPAAAAGAAGAAADDPMDAETYGAQASCSRACTAAMWATRIWTRRQRECGACAAACHRCRCRCGCGAVDGGRWKFVGAAAWVQCAR